MISAEEKEKIKKEIVEKVNSVLEKNGESFRLDKVNILNKNESVKFMGITGCMTGEIMIPSQEKSIPF